MGSPRRRGRFSVSVVALATALFFIPGVPAAVGATTHEVTCPGESLQDAIDAAAPGDTIVVNGTCFELLTLDRDLTLTSTTDAVLDGDTAGSVLTILSGVEAYLGGLAIENGAAPYGAGVHVDAGARLVGNGIRISNNIAQQGGGAIFNEGDVYLVQSVISHNVALTTEWGDAVYAGGLANVGTMELDQVELFGNEGEYAGAVGNAEPGSLTISSSHFHDQGSYEEVAPDYWEVLGASWLGGGIANDGSAVISDTLFDRNYAGSDGGAIFNGGDLTVVRSTFIHNGTSDGGGNGGGAGIYTYGVAAIVDSHFSENLALEDPGGGIFNSGEITVSGSTFTDNWSEWPGAGLANGKAYFTGSALLHLSDSAFSGNYSEYGAGALFAGGEVHASGLDISNNSDVSVEVFGVTRISDSTIANTVSIDPFESGLHCGEGIVLIDGRMWLDNVDVIDNECWGVVVAEDMDVETVHGAFIKDSTIMGNSGGLYAAAGETAVESTGFLDNQGADGGAVHVTSGASVYLKEGSSATTNSAERGGAAFVDGGRLEIIDSLLDHNSASMTGGGVHAENGGDVWIRNSTINDHYANWNGGAIFASGSAVDIGESILNANEAKGGAAIAATNRSTVMVVGSQLSYNVAEEYGGGILNVASDLVLEGTSVTQNQAGLNGGGVSNRYGSAGSASLLAINSTIASNHGDAGSGIENRNGTVTLDHVTLTDNVRGPGLFEQTWARNAVVANSILAGNRAGDCDVNPLTSGGGNVFGPGCDVAAAQGTDALGVADPLLEFDGSVAVIEWATPLPGSPAIDRIPVSACTQPVDQAGTSRPLGAGCDSGAIEADVTGPDVEPPLVDADFAHGDSFPVGVVSFTGAASDNVGVTWIGVAIQRLDTKEWLQDDEVSWGNFNRFEADLSDPGGVATDWSFSVALPDNRYVFSALAKDAAGNEGRIVPWRLFVVEGADTTSPVVDADFGHNAELPAGSALTGTATDDVGVTWVGIAIQRLDTKQWLQDDEVSWGNFNRIEATLSDPGAVATDWSLVVDLPVGHYVLSARAKDAAGNSGYIVPWRGFYII